MKNFSLSLGPLNLWISKISSLTAPVQTEVVAARDPPTNLINSSCVSEAVRRQLIFALIRRIQTLLAVYICFARWSFHILYAKFALADHSSELFFCKLDSNPHRFGFSQHRPIAIFHSSRHVEFTTLDLLNLRNDQHSLRSYDSL